MTDEKQKNIMTIPTQRYAIDMIPTANLTSISTHKGSDDQVQMFSSKQVEPSYFSNQTVKVMQNILDLEAKTQSTYGGGYKERFTLEEQLFDAKAEVKILLSKVSMHFSEALRKKLFRQIDLLHDPDGWEEGDIPIQLQSFNTFLRWFFLNEPFKLPNFGLSATGHFIASWLTNHNKDSLVLEFLSNDRIKWFVTKYYGEEVDLSSGSTKLSRIANVLEPYHPADWVSKKA